MDGFERGAKANDMAKTFGLHRTTVLRISQMYQQYRALFPPQPSTANSTRRFSPYQQQHRRNTIRRSSVPSAINCNARLQQDAALDPLTPSTPITTTITSNVYNKQPSLLIKPTTTAESLQIQKIVMTALTTLRLPSHSIVLALYFVHKLLTIKITSSPSSAFPSLPSPPSMKSTTSFQYPIANGNNNCNNNDNKNNDQFSTNPVFLFLAGLMLADSVLCDAPVSVGTWSWILKHSCPPFSAMSLLVNGGVSSGKRQQKQQQQGGQYFARDVRKWALDTLEFEVSVGVEVYGEWVNGVKVFTEGVELRKKQQEQARK
ncbi:UNVERIFIED_CONTAM: hypothetical protein HDU68_010343 [Siphonaria sp. JEL0065]|nr:hypothetical protein HDU68_010343 [Siphonaria sp. JEL0065]